LEPGIKVKEFDKQQIESLYGMVQSVIGISYPDVYPPEAVRYFKEHHTKEDILNDASAGYTLIADYGGEILGTGTLLDTNVRRVYINPIHQHQGIGKLIVTKLEKRALKNKIIALDLSASLISKRFWESLGYCINSEEFLPLENDQSLHYYKMVKILKRNRQF
jgi:GNAT superfamily N-acetyltransferase